MIDCHRSISALAVIAFIVGVALQPACTTTETRVRVAGRAGTIHDVALIPTIDTAPMRIDAGADVLTDAELTALQKRLPTTLQGVLADVDQATTTDPVGLVGILRNGTLQALRIKVKAAAGRDKHRTIVECRLRVKAGDDVLADVEGSAVQLVQARNLSVIELDGITTEMMDNGGRNPLLAVEDTEAAIVSACSAALHAIVDDTRPGDDDIDADNSRGAARADRSSTRQDRRRRALDRVHAEEAREVRKDDALAAALVDLGDTGGPADAPIAAGHLFDVHPLVRRAADRAFGILCAGHRLLPPDDLAHAACVRPEPPPPPVDDGEDGDRDDDDDDDGPIRGAAPVGAPDDGGTSLAPANDDDSDDDNDNPPPRRLDSPPPTEPAPRQPGADDGGR